MENNQVVSTQVSKANGKHEPTREELLARIAQLEAKAATRQTISFRVTKETKNEQTGKVTGTNGAVSMYGLGRFPVTLYKSQWKALIAAIPDLQTFLKVHDSELAVKE